MKNTLDEYKRKISNSEPIINQPSIKLFKMIPTISNVHFIIYNSKRKQCPKFSRYQWRPVNLFICIALLSPNKKIIIVKNSLCLKKLKIITYLFNYLQKKLKKKSKI